MWNSGFFNSVNGDRVYNADQMSAIFTGLITDGVYASVGNKLAVQPNSGMTIQIATGRGWFGKRWVDNDSEYLYTLEASDVILNRYCAVCVRVDTTDGGRKAEPYFKYSEYATNPVKPSMERTETIKEYCLAYVLIKAGATSITAADIEDTRSNETLCGWVTGLIEQLSSATLFDQFTDIFYNWFNGLGDLINENTETMLVGAMPQSLTVELSANGWVNKTQSVVVTGMNATKSVIIQANDETVEVYNNAGVKCTSQDANTLLFTCDTVPSETIKVNVLHMGA